ncbi:Type 1 glutamine amidotransferase-like domain-containing protein [Paenalkalicoccus suaedae]|uniref:Type 1 glutamine amidotransferase-like domain-containing protein n=1 Tax=Paenalkalicoccus suaedae TaxID=2592382 RepID=A0A859FJP0_9BACI|nr:Type 1 glutamine amidotransferase-like domain-containing protein [Paenalkalicoccus suaedae]QKS73008.1 Type 1 glutamine amidotransferase-like domain-containing protein [Paenalkalicoccus suaedae]
MKHLFLFGGGPPFTHKLAQLFTKVRKSESPVIFLVLEREVWADFIPYYADLLKANRVQECRFLPLPTTDIDEAVAAIEQSSGIVIGGGDTNRYADSIVDTPINKAIHAHYQAGHPVAGFSADALITPERCVISAKDNDERELQSRPGLGLFGDMLIALHYSEWDEEMHVRKSVQTYSPQQNLALDEQTGAYFRNGELVEVDGAGGVYTLEEGEIHRVE